MKLEGTRFISLESNQVFHGATKISADSDIADEDKVLVQFESCGRGLLTGFRICIPDLDLELIKNGIAFRRLPF